MRNKKVDQYIRVYSCWLAGLILDKNPTVNLLTKISLAFVNCVESVSVKMCINRDLAADPGWDLLS